jgi:putative oxidoreductase
MRRLLATDDSLALLLQRAVLALVIWPHGAQKLLGWYGGLGFSGVLAYFTDVVHVPAPLGVLVILAESIGALLLLLGAATRIAAFGINASLLGAMCLVHWQHGFFMNWFGNQAGEGIEFDLLVFGLGIPLMLYGGGRWSVDRALSLARSQKPAPKPALQPA